MHRMHASTGYHLFHFSLLVIDTLAALKPEARESLLSTALALVLLSTRFTEFKAEWTMLYAKARRWLQREAKKVCMFET